MFDPSGLYHPPGANGTGPDTRRFLTPDPAEYSGLLGADGRPLRRGEEPGRYDQMPVPQVITFSALLGSAWRKFQSDRFDEARRHHYEDSLAMERDCSLMAIVNERKLAAASLDWHLEVENERDPHEKTLKDGLTQVVKATPHLQKMLYWLLDAVYRGRSGASLRYVWKHLRCPTPQGRPAARRCLSVARWLPVNGDKLGHSFDGTPYLRVNAGEAERQLPGAHLSYCDQGRAVDLVKSGLRDNFLLHAHEVSDADFYDAERAEAAYGLGLRHFLYWHWWLKAEWIANITDWIERAGLGMRLWYYQAGNKESQKAVEQAARDNVRRTNILIPRYPNAQGHATEQVEFQDVATGGAEVLVKLVEYLDQSMERFVIGQTLSSNTEGSGLGGTGVSALHGATKYKIIAFDANNLADTLTADWLEVQKRFTFPEYHDIPCRWVFDLEANDPEKTLSAIKTAFDMGVSFPEDKVREPTGVPAPEQGDRVLSKAAQDQETAQLQQQSQAPAATPPGVTGPMAPAPESGALAAPEAPPTASAAGAAPEPAAPPPAPSPAPAGAAPEAPAPVPALSRPEVADEPGTATMPRLATGLPLIEGGQPPLPTLPGGAPLVESYGAGFDPAAHPRGHEGKDSRGVENPGQFGSGQSKTAPAGTRPDPAPARAPEAPRQPASPAPAASTPRHRELAETPVARAGTLRRRGQNVTVLLTLADGSRAVWKPADGEAPRLRACVPGDYWKREVAASALAEVLDLGDLVPPTVARTIGNQTGSCQHYLDGAVDAVDMERAERFDGPADLARAAAFDFLTLNTDRHLGNWMLRPSVDDDHGLRLIDNGLAFPDTHDRPEHGHSQLLAQAMQGSMTIPSEVAAWAGKEAEVRAVLEGHLGAGPAVELAMQRFGQLTQAAAAGTSFHALWRAAGIQTINALHDYHEATAGTTGPPEALPEAKSYQPVTGWV